MQTLIGLAIIIGMMWGAIKFLVGIPFGIAILVIIVIVWNAALK